MQAHVDLVADLGEGFGDWTMGDDASLLEIVTSANVACGFHAGDPRIMDATARACAERGIQIGAHPSFPDLVGFGRRAEDFVGDREQQWPELGELRCVSIGSGHDATAWASSAAVLVPSRLVRLSSPDCAMRSMSALPVAI